MVMPWDEICFLATYYYVLYERNVRNNTHFVEHMNGLCNEIQWNCMNCVWDWYTYVFINFSFCSELWTKIRWTRISHDLWTLRKMVDTSFGIQIDLKYTTVTQFVWYCSLIHFGKTSSFPIDNKSTNKERSANERIVIVMKHHYET